MKEFEQRVIDVMIFNKIIPALGKFQITDHHINEYISIYGEIFSKSNTGLKRQNEYRFARKLAGRTLTSLLNSRGFKFNEIDAGMVYMISNPAFPMHYKIGMTLDVIDRLSSYQTYDPYKQFKVVKYNFVLNRKLIERQLLNHPDLFKDTGEWILKQNAELVFSKITDYIPG